MLGAPAPQATTESMPDSVVEDLDAALRSGVPEDALDAMAELEAARYDQIQEEIPQAESTSSQKRALGGCTLSKLRVRREWYVSRKKKRKNLREIH